MNRGSFVSKIEQAILLEGENFYSQLIFFHNIEQLIPLPFVNEKSYLYKRINKSNKLR